MMQMLLAILYLAWACLSVAQQQSANISQTEYEALKDLFYSTEGDNWTWLPAGTETHWDFSVYEDPCTSKWEGVNCTLGFGNVWHVSMILLSKHNLQGTLPDSIGNFPHLASLVLKYNSLCGSIPNTLNNLVNLQTLSLNNNKLSKKLPETLANLTKLREFDLWTNELTGTIPTYVRLFRRLEYFDVSVNKLTGEIPAFLGDLHKLEYLYVDQNSLHGTIPSSLGRLERVSYFYAATNQLTGTVPPELSNMKSLAYFFLFHNKLSGSLDNVFNASAQPNLTVVRIANNRFTGALPDQLFLLPQLTVIDAVGNCITNDQLSDVVCSATSLQAIALDGLHTSQHCRKDLLPAVTSTYRMTPSLRGSLPHCIFELPSLVSLHLSSNGITGTLPKNVHFGVNFTDLELSHNFFKDSIPDAFQSHSWTNLDLSYNKFSGTLSSNFTVRSGMALKLKDNRLSGPLPNSVINADSKIYVLEGNLFGCEQDESDLPQEDQYVQQYQCGSNSFNVAYYVWLILAFFLVCGAMLYFAHRKEKVIAFSTTFGRMMHNARRAVRVLDLKLNVEEFEFDLGRAATTEREVQSVHEAPEDPRQLKYHLRNYHKICMICQLILRGCVALTVYIVVVLMPLYGILSVFGSTLTHEYAYQLSLAFLTGVEPLVFCMIFLMICLVFLFRWFTVFYEEFTIRFRNFETEIHYDDRKERTDSAASTESSKSRAVVYLGRGKGAMYVSLIVLNMCVVFGANTGFVQMLYGNATTVSLAQFTLSVFKFAWSWVCSRVTYLLARHLDKHHEDLKKGLFSTLCIITLFNNIVVPCLVVMAISTPCFYHVFAKSDEVEVTYSYIECEEFVRAECINKPIFVKNSYQPPFVYSYQCAGTILSYYAPSFMYTSIIQGIWFPLVRWTVARILKTWSPHTLGYQLLLSISPLILKPVPATSEPPPADVGPFFDSRSFVAMLLNYLAVIMTFGVVFPPVAFAMTITIISTVFFTRHEIKRFLKDAAHKGSFKYIDRIDQECVGVGSSVLLTRAISLLVTLSCWFYSLFLFDILGDRQQLAGAYWVLVMMIFLPAFLFAWYEVYLLTGWLFSVYSRSTTADNILHIDETTSPLPHDKRPRSMQIEMIARPKSTNTLSDSTV